MKCEHRTCITSSRTTHVHLLPARLMTILTTGYANCEQEAHLYFAWFYPVFLIELFWGLVFLVVAVMHTNTFVSIVCEYRLWVSFVSIVCEYRLLVSLRDLEHKMCGENNLCADEKQTVKCGKYSLSGTSCPSRTVAWLRAFFFWVKGPAADATDAPQAWGLLCNRGMKMINFFFFRFSL